MEEANMLDSTLSALITAFHILHRYKILDEHGHISVRHPTDPSTFFTSNVPAILVFSKRDLNQWRVRDGSPVTESHPTTGCQIVEADKVPEGSEHYLHSCVYNAYPGVLSVVHSHAIEAVVFGLCDASGSMMQPSYRDAGYLGPSSPIFDAAKHYGSLPWSHRQNLLIDHVRLGDAVAKTFNGVDASSSPSSPSSTAVPAHTVVFERGHGFDTWAENIPDAVWRAIHVRRNGLIQAAAMEQRGSTDLEVIYLSDRECRDCKDTTNRATPLIWKAWAAEVERSGMYHNEMKGQRQR
ncbi:uncharacterized protein PV07_04748 [Cladophialophora immunda]|uniref:Class II aldolase/adducin N-terminal domain-containing protein n=1 Tax=Cladophialophora immunda TaxID=569365 RepID=A0A0D2CCT2_9EURO|nr:uncharacterized protein PV07_04748 [Cladophialophora immunda]KIW28893.1 hypothetical protein PV07_04748 [Cladophialophora immunda]OQV08776.1 Clas II Aldolase and Adducin domain-containing protein [Cladophialophora immunda]